MGKTARLGLVVGCALSLDSAAPDAADCNENGVRDDCEIANRVRLGDFSSSGFDSRGLDGRRIHAADLDGDGAAAIHGQVDSSPSIAVRHYGTMELREDALAAAG